MRHPFYKSGSIELLRASEGLEATTSEANREEQTGEAPDVRRDSRRRSKKKRRSFSTFGGTIGASLFSEGIEEKDTYKND